MSDDSMIEHLDVVQLRDAFDAAFAEPFGVADARSDASLRRFVIVRASGARHAIAIDEIAGVYKNVEVVGMRSTRGAMIGLAGVRSRLVVVFDLTALLSDAPPDRGTRAHRWLIVTRRVKAAAFAIDSYDGYLELPADVSIIPDTERSGDVASSWILGTIESQNGAHSRVVNLNALLDHLEERADMNQDFAARRT